MKHSGQIQLFNLWSKAFISACSSRPQSVTKGTQVGAEAETMEGCSSTNLLSGSRSASSLGQPISTCLGMVLPIVGWVLPRQSSAKALPQRLDHSLPDGGNSSVEMRLPRGLKIVSSWQQKSIHYTFLVFPFCGRQKKKSAKKVAANLPQSPRPSMKRPRLLDKFCVYMTAFNGQWDKSAP